MDDKKQEGKKTVVAFAAGLIVGGLLVWLFAGSPEATAPDSTSNDDAADAVLDEGTRDGEEVDAATTTDDSTRDDFTFTVANQPVGTIVLLREAKYPTQEGWIVVHEDMSGELGSALGAARYDTEARLTPNRIQLLRTTQAGKTYRVVYYAESGDNMFDLKEDTPMTTGTGALVQATFTAQ